MKNLKSALGLMLLATLMWACGPKGQTVETSDAQEVNNAKESVAVALNTASSTVTWIGSKPAGKHNGTIAVSAGEVLVNENELVGGNFTIDITSLTVLDLPAESEWNAKLKGHLMSPDFFAADSFPSATFEITRVAAFAQENLVADKEEFKTEYTPASLSEIIVDSPTHFVSGNLTIRGITKNITFPASVKVENGAVKAVANFNIDRTEWKLMYQDEATVADKAKDKFIYNTVNVGFEIEAGTQSSL